MRNERLEDALSMGAEEVITIMKKNDDYGVFFHGVCEHIPLDPVIMGMCCNLMIKNYVDALPDSVQIQATELCYKAIEALRAYPEDNERTPEEVFGEE